MIAELSSVQDSVLALTRSDRELVSDGYHSFGELYNHRMILTVLALKSMGMSPWRSMLHHDGTMFDGYFIVGADLPGIGQVSYHYGVEHWELFNKFPVLERAPEWDGHTPDDVCMRLQEWILKRF